MSAHSSIFTYNLSRAYPFKWFTPVALLGGLIILVLVSLLNIATAGYQLVSISTPDPNGTESSRQWISHWPSFLIGSMRPSCEPTTIHIPSQLYTNNTMLLYTLTGVRSEVSNNSYLNMKPAYGSLVYQNNVLQNCTGPMISINIDASNDRTTMQMVVEQTRVYMTAYVTCQVEGAQGSVLVDLTTSYEYVTADNPDIYQYFPGRNPVEKSSLWWGESLLALFWCQLVSSYSQRGQDFKSLTKGVVLLETAISCDETIPEMDSALFRFFGCYFFSDILDQPKVEPPTVSPYFHQCEVPSQMWGPLNSLTRAFYYTILADLGQNNSTCKNPLVDATLLQEYTANYSTIVEEIYITDVYMGPYPPPGPQPGLAAGSYEETKKSIEGRGFSFNLGIGPSTLASSYICQVPRLKPTGTLVFAVLVADLVLLQGLWKLFTFCVSYTVTRKKPEMNFCSGCLEKTEPPCSKETSSTSTLERSEGAGFLSRARTSSKSKPKRRIYRRAVGGQNSRESFSGERTPMADDAV